MQMIKGGVRGGRTHGKDKYDKMLRDKGEKVERRKEHLNERVSAQNDRSVAIVRLEVSVVGEGRTQGEETTEGKLAMC